MLALHAFDTYGLEVSSAAIKTAEAYAAHELAEPRPINYGNKDDPAVSELGLVKFIEGDFFSRDWEKDINFQDAGGFDLIYDYTVSAFERM